MDDQRNQDQRQQEIAQETQEVELPIKLIRIGTMTSELLDEIRRIELDEASRDRLREIYETSVKELAEILSPELRSELEELTTPIADGTPSVAELRLSHAQLVGWLQGLFQGIQSALLAQQTESRARLKEMRRGRPTPGDRSRRTPLRGHICRYVRRQRRASPHWRLPELEFRLLTFDR